MELKTVAVIHTAFPTKFGIPRQSGLVEQLEARIVFEPEYRDPSAIRGLEGFSHLWLLWHFSENVRETWSPTVRPPRLGGNRRMGVFATRSPFRPNPIGLSCVRLLRIENGELIVSGADLMDKTPIFDIKPYLPYTDARPDAIGGFSESVYENTLRVCYACDTSSLDDTFKQALGEILAEDPRPHYVSDPERVYGFPFAGKEIRFSVSGELLTVLSIE